jgi:hypothetical protein
VVGCGDDGSMGAAAGPVAGVMLQRSFTVHGDEKWAAEQHAELADTYGVRHAFRVGG